MLHYCYLITIGVMKLNLLELKERIEKKARATRARRAYQEKWDYSKTCRTCESKAYSKFYCTECWNKLMNEKGERY